MDTDRVMLNRASGFTLMEMVIVVAIVGILAAIAYPTYQESVRKSRRGEAQAALTGMAAAMERNFLRANAYTSPSSFYPTQVPLEGGTATYNLSATLGTPAGGYTLNAAPTGAQAGDRCGTLTLSSAGAQGPTNPADCWRR